MKRKGLSGSAWAATPKAAADGVSAATKASPASLAGAAQGQNRVSTAKRKRSRTS